MQETRIDKNQARKILLSAQGFENRRLSASQILGHLGYVQIDTISVVERAHHHVFWSRDHNYAPKDLEELISSRQGFEYWSHAAAYLPMRDYRFTLPMKRAFQQKESNWFPKNGDLETRILDCIRLEGPKMSRDFEASAKTRSGWWDWKPAKKALERLFLEGRLEITARKGFQKVYDLPERVIPSWVDTSIPNDSEYFRHLILSNLRHHGLSTAQEMAYLRSPKIKAGVKKELQTMLEVGDVLAITISDLPSVYYALPDYEKHLKKSEYAPVILSPFDNLLIQRKKVKDIFEFDYQIECYVPEPKRKFGYFSLPILFQDQLVAQMDCKADRKSQTLFINSFHVTNGLDREMLFHNLQDQLEKFSKFNGCVQLAYDKAVVLSRK